MGVVLYVLGPLKLAVDGEDVPLRPAQRRVLATLATLGGNDIDTDALIDKMWLDSPPDNARTSLQVHVSGIRRAAPSLIQTEGSRYRLHRDIKLDTTDFGTLIDDATAAAADNAWNDVLEHADAALSMWRGEPLIELAHNPSVRAEIVRLNEQQLEAIELRMHALLSLGRYSEALPELQALVTDHPLHERFRYHVMVALYRSGRQVEALRTYQELRTMLGEEIGIEPDPSLRLLEERILLQDPSLGDPLHIAIPNNLPVSSTSFVGRDSAAEKISARLGTTRLMTIIGGPGFGKTRLAVEIGHSQLENYPGGVWFAGLADALTADDVAAVIGSATRIQDEATGLPELGRALAPRRSLLILDNCEHMIDACASFVSAALAEGGDLRIIATSRTPLRVDGEQVWQLDPLSVPPDVSGEIGPADALASPAVRLFVDRAKAVDRTFSLTAESAPMIVHLSRQLAGIPLAIELASRWVPALGVSDITAMLDPAIDVNSGDTVQPASSLREAIEWSLALLPEEDRSLAAHAAIFTGSFGMSDVHAICSKNRPGPTFAAMMSRVVSSSLLQAERRSDGTARYRMLTPIREFLLAQPDDSRSDQRELFTRHYLAKAWSWKVDRFASVSNLSTIDDDIENLRTAMDLGLKYGRVHDVAVALEPLANYFHQRYMILESRSWHRRLLEHDLTAEDESTALRVVGAAQAVFGHLHEAEELLGRAIAIADTLEDKSNKARCLLTLSAVQNRLGRWQQGLAAAREALGIAFTLDNRFATASAEYFIGESLLDMGEFAEGRSAMLQCAETHVRTGEPQRAAYTGTRIAVAAVLSGEPDVGRESLTHAKELIVGSNSDFRNVKLLTTEALFEAIDGDVGRAARLILEAQSIIERSHDDDIFDVLLPAAVVFVLSHRWNEAGAMILGIRSVIDRSERKLPVPWQNALNSWEADVGHELGARFERMSDGARLATFESLMESALNGLREVAQT